MDARTWTPPSPPSWPGAAEHAPGARCVVVRGRYGHVSFILDPAPVRVRVLEVVPPWPPKLVDQVSRVLDVAEDLPPVELVPELVDLRRPGRPAARPARYLFPCRGGGMRAARGAAEVVLPRRDPAAREPWTLVGCARSRADPRLVLRRRGAAGRHVPAQPGRAAERRRRLAADQVLPARGPGRATADTVVVPWGASLAQISRRPAPGGDGSAPSGARAMTDRIADSALYRHLWGTAEARAVLGEERPAAGLAGRDRGAGPGPGRGRA